MSAIPDVNVDGMMCDINDTNPAITGSDGR